MTLSVVVPCYNEEKNIAPLAQAFAQTDFGADTLELILVDNGSRDGTGAQIAQQAAAYPFIKAVRVAQNQGYGYGILQGLAEATGELVGWQHADLETHPREFVTFLTAYHAGEMPSCVFARANRKNRPLSARFFTFGMACFESLLFGRWMYDIMAHPTVMSREIYESWVAPPKEFALDLYAYYWALAHGWAVYRWPVEMRARLHGASSWNTGLASHIRLARKTVGWSIALKREIDARVRAEKSASS